MSQSLPADWVDKIFARLQGAYGREFTGQFSIIDQTTGIDIGIENAKVVWGQELAMFYGNDHAIRHALHSLPEKAPNVIRFREICRQAPARRVEQEPGKQIVYENKGNYIPESKSVHEHIRNVRLALGMPEFGNNKAWAKKILEEHENGVKKTPAVLAMAKKALSYGQNNGRD